MKKLIIWYIRNFHSWHKDWVGCWKCEYLLRNNFLKIKGDILVRNFRKE